LEDERLKELFISEVMIFDAEHLMSLRKNISPKGKKRQNREGELSSRL
jgi:hypothetical protein